MGSIRKKVFICYFLDIQITYLPLYNIRLKKKLNLLCNTLKMEAGVT